MLNTWRFIQQKPFPESLGLIFKLDINQPKHDNELCFWVPVSIKTSSVLQTVMALMAVLVFLLQHLKSIDNTGIRESTQGRTFIDWFDSSRISLFVIFFRLLWINMENIKKVYTGADIRNEIGPKILTDSVLQYLNLDHLTMNLSELIISGVVSNNIKVKV